MQGEVMATAATPAIEAWDRRWVTSRGRPDRLDPTAAGAEGPHHSTVITGIDAFIATSAAGKRGVAGPAPALRDRAPPTQRQALRLVAYSAAARAARFGVGSSGRPGWPVNRSPSSH